MNKYTLIIMYASLNGQKTHYYHEGNVAHIMKMPNFSYSSKVIQIIAKDDKAAKKQASATLNKTDLKDALLAALAKREYPDDDRTWICELLFHGEGDKFRWLKKFREKKPAPPLGDLFPELLEAGD